MTPPEPHQPDPAGDSAAKASESRAHRWWTLAGGAGILTTLLSLWFGGPLQDQYAKARLDDDAEKTVQLLIADLVAAGHAPLGERQDYVDRAHALTTEDVPDKVWTQWEVGPDPYVWTALELDSGDETRKKAFVGPRDDGPWALRRAKSGCWKLRGEFQLVRKRGEWRIKKLPAFDGRCGDDLLRTTWDGGDLERGVIGWDGTFQRIDPVASEYSDPVLLKERQNTGRSWNAQKSFDIRAPATHDGQLVTVGDLSTAWGVSAPVVYDEDDPESRCWGVLEYTFPTTVNLLRIRLYNGVDAGGRYEKYGRIRTATIEAGDRRVEAVFKSRLGSQRVDCAFGPVDSVRIDITGVWPGQGESPAESDVSLSQIDFWGMPPEARIAAPPPIGAYAWSDVADRRPDEEDIAECRDDEPPPEVVAEPTPVPTATPVPPVQPISEVPPPADQPAVATTPEPAPASKTAPPPAPAAEATPVP